MRISDLSRASGVPIATIKYYLRENLLPPGQLTAATQARYDESHVSRLRLIRALLGPGGLTVAAARALLAHVDQPADLSVDLLGVAHRAVGRPLPLDRDLTRARTLMRRWGWVIDEKDCDTQAELAEALDAIDSADFQVPEEVLDAYARAIAEIAELEIANMPTESAQAAVRYVVLGTVLVEPLLLAMRRLAEQNASVARFAGHDVRTGRVPSASG